MRRLARLETRAEAKDTMGSISMTIHFVSPEKGVTKRLLIEGDKQIWTSVTPGDSGKAEEV